jgi:hypothetical protein
MARKAFDEARDQRIANEAGGDKALMCCALRCPNRWSVDGERGKCCSAHAWSDHKLWPQITQEQLDAESDRAIAAAMPKAEGGQVDKRAAIQALQRFVARTNGG